MDIDKKFMIMALKEAQIAAEQGEIPIGAILVKNGQVIAKDHNRCIELNDPTAHAEILVLRKAGKILKNYRLNGSIIYVTAEPCSMCVSALIHGRVSGLVFGTLEPKTGAIKSRLRLLENRYFNHKVEVKKGILERECKEILKEFFKNRRIKK